jgi:ketosteroid isomerase-like protein
VETLLSRNLVDVFGEPEALKRRVAIAEIWTNDGIFAEPHGRHVGQEALNEAVGQLHRRFPDFVFTAIGSPQAFYDVGRLAWGHGPAGEPPRVTGLDVITVRDGRIASLYTFIDSLPTE